jgi:hypothetical protein
MKEIKQICNAIVGTWYSEKLEMSLTFFLNEELLRESKIIIKYKDNKPLETIYGIAVHPRLKDSDYQFYFDVGRTNKLYYYILSISKNELVIQEFYMKPDTPASKDEIHFYRKIDVQPVDEILNNNFT